MAPGRRIARWLVLAPLMLIGLLWIVTWPPSIPSYAEVRGAWQPTESWLYDRDGRLLDSVRIDFSQRRLEWVPIGGIARTLQDAVVAAEDRGFRAHRGVDWLAIGGSIRDGAGGNRARGASTITMQLAAYLAPALARPGSRSVWQKLRQIRAAMAIERSWSKDQILEAYLNLAGFRGETQGVMSASRSLFGKPPVDLSADDATILTALLPAPQAEPAAVTRRACRLRPAACPTMTARIAEALGPIRSLADDPGLASHLATRLLPRAGMKVTTRIDAGVQRVAIAALSRQLIGLGDQRARDGAVVVPDNASGDVLAYVGGVGGGSTAASVDGAQAYRQAGSTLKPFLYAAAIERGYLTAASILDDSPVQLDTASGLYIPQNYDRGFRGPVSARTALASSLNVPAVRTLMLVGVDNFRDRLWDLGYHGLTEDGAYYGFSLALGSAEVTLLEQANAYRALANGGRWTPARVVAGDPAGTPRLVIDPAAAWIVDDMLADPGARAGTFGLESALRLPFWSAVKTGTSKAMRDNWCVGFTRAVTVAVWIGNLEGDSMRAVSGTSGAAPVWREVMLALHGLGAPPPEPRPTGVEARAISFEAAIEPPRREYFLIGTGQSRFGIPPGQAQRPHITSPVAGSVYALDPDIPIGQQRIRVTVTGDVQGLALMLDRVNLGPAAAQPLILPGPGQHRLKLVDKEGKLADQILFSIR